VKLSYDKGIWRFYDKHNIISIAHVLFHIYSQGKFFYILFLYLLIFQLSTSFVTTMRSV